MLCKLCAGQGYLTNGGGRWYECSCRNEMKSQHDESDQEEKNKETRKRKKWN
jgi:hypothetical protein